MSRYTRLPAIGRRRFLQTTAAATSVALLHSAEAADAPAVWPLGTRRKTLRPRSDLLDEKSPKGIEVFQLTAEPSVPSSHLYMEAQIFTLDSQRFVLHRSATAHGGDKNDPKHQYLLCDLADGASLTALTDEKGATALSVSPVEPVAYYFVNETKMGGGRLTLKRVGLDGSDRRTLLVIDAPLPGTKYRPSGIYPLSTISSDGQRLALSACFGDGQADPPPYGLMVFDLRAGSVRVVLEGPTWCNMHPQYSRSLDPSQSHDILVQENHGCVVDKNGAMQKLTGGEGADIHLVRDDGSQFRNLPWGRDNNEFCQGHQCWRGRSAWAITSTSTRDVREAQLIEGAAAPFAGHVGKNTPGGRRNDLSRSFPRPQFYHFATDLAGARLVSDAPKGCIYVAELGEPGQDAARAFGYLLCSKSTGVKTAHVHPFLSPNGKRAFFNSDETGTLQAYMICGL